MQPITIPAHFVMASAASAWCLLLIFLERKRLFSRKPLLGISATVFFVVYLIIVCTAAIDDVQNQQELNTYDLDKDGFFSTYEQTEQQKLAMQRLTNDASWVISGLIFAFVTSLAVYFAGSVVKRAKQQ